MVDLQSLLDLLPTPVFRLDRDGRHTFANLAAARAIGVERSTLLGRTPGQAGIPPHLAVDIERHVQRVVATGTPAEYQVTAPTPGGPVTFLCRLVPEHAADGSVQAVLGVATDVTAREQAQRALLESEERFRHLVDGVTDYAIFLLDTEGRVASWNPGAARIKGWTEAEILGRSLAEFYVDEEVAAGRPARALGKARDDGRHEEEGWRRRKDGSRFWASVVLTALRDPAGALRGFSKVTRDLSKRRAVEEALRISENRYRQVVEDQTEVVCRFLADGTFTFVNEIYCRTFGRSAEQLLGHTWQPVVLPDDLELVREKLSEMSSTHPVVRIENRVLDGAGRVRWMEFINRGFHAADGTLLEVQAVGRDVTDRRAAEDARRELELSLREKEQQSRYERQMMQSQKLESLGVLAGGIAHDFNNLLTAVLGYASLARMRIAPGDAVGDDLGQIERAAMRAAELCQQMLAYAGRGQFIVTAVDLNTLTEEMSQLLATAINKRAVLKFNLMQRLPTVRADATQLRQVVMNLITNASDAIGERSGVITVTTGLIDADLRYLREIHAPDDLPAGRYVYLEVSDNGCGMPDAVRERIFDPFFTTKFTGRGLGLAAVQGIVRAHKGAIKVYTQQGKGTTFKVLLPALAPVESFAPKSPVAPALAGRGRAVLVVDDEEDVRVFVRKVLEHHGFAVAVAVDGRDGVRAFTADGAEFDLVLLDLTMPHLSGGDAFRLLRAHRPEVQVVLTSGFAEEEATSGFQGKGLAGFLRKPFRAQELLAMVRLAIGG
ncbi:MAG: PAS domain S-box protein [Planctomycetes bacterium]|nr:PAS domain S-box protein [Planctomycetota bacterium]